ncbi:MAG: class II aldolase/adducin family protein, partial [Chloroflexota bacterium]
MSELTKQEAQARIDLAAALRWTARLDLHEAVANHYSVVIGDGDDQEILLNPKLKHFSRVKASDIVKFDLDADDVLERPDAPDISAWYLHSHLHKHLPHAKVIFHTHMPNTLALACMKDFEFMMLDQNATRFYDRIAYDRDYNGLAMDDNEGERVASLMQDGKSVLFMGNHGVMILGETVS